MAEKDTVFSSRIKYNGVFSFKDFYKFCYDWLSQETGLHISENKYSEKIIGDSKKIDVEWTGKKQITDYFLFEAKITMKTTELINVEISEKGAKVQTNKGSIEIQIKSMLVKDYKGKFETSAFKKFLRSCYEKWVIPSRIGEYEQKVSGESDEFISQAKTYLDLEGKK